MIKFMGFNLVCILVLYFIFGDCELFIGCVKEFDKVFVWVDKYGFSILIDLYIVLGS